MNNIINYHTRLVSVIIPVYNVENYLEKCIYSVVNQTYNNIEVICIEDKSTDNSLNLLKQIKLKNPKFNIKIIENLTNQGLSAARNLGVENAKGYYLTFLDSDDYINEGYIESLVAKAENTSSDIVIASCVKFDNENYFDHRNYEEELNNKHTLNYFRLPVMAWGKLYLTSFIHKNHFKFEKGLLHEDEVWSLQVLTATRKISLSSNALYYYRQRFGSIMDTRCKMSVEYARKYLEMLYCLYYTNNKLFYNGQYKRRFFAKYYLRILQLMDSTLNLIIESKLNINDKQNVLRDYDQFLIKHYGTIDILKNVRPNTLKIVKKLLKQRNALIYTIGTIISK